MLRCTVARPGSLLQQQRHGPVEPRRCSFLHHDPGGEQGMKRLPGSQSPQRHHHRRGGDSGVSLQETERRRGRGRMDGPCHRLPPSAAQLTFSMLCPQQHVGDFSPASLSAAPLVTLISHPHPASGHRYCSPSCKLIEVSTAVLPVWQGTRRVLRLPSLHLSPGEESRNGHTVWNRRRPWQDFPEIARSPVELSIIDGVTGSGPVKACSCGKSHAGVAADIPGPA